MKRGQNPRHDAKRNGRWAWPAYVYALADPRNGEIFYYGHGRADRILDHDREAALGILTPKCRRIREIWADGLSIDRRIVGLFSSKRAARAFELELIRSAPPDRLTNYRGSHA